MPRRRDPKSELKKVGMPTIIESIGSGLISELDIGMPSEAATLQLIIAQMLEIVKRFDPKLKNQIASVLAKIRVLELFPTLTLAQQMMLIHSLPTLRSPRTDHDGNTLQIQRDIALLWIQQTGYSSRGALLSKETWVENEEVTLAFYLSFLSCHCGYPTLPTSGSPTRTRLKDLTAKKKAKIREWIPEWGNALLHGPPILVYSILGRLHNTSAAAIEQALKRFHRRTGSQSR